VFLGLALAGRLDVILVLCAAGAMGYLMKLLPQAGRVLAAHAPASTPGVPGPDPRPARAARRPRPGAPLGFPARAA